MLSASTRLGPYEIVAPPGAGGVDEMSGLAMLGRSGLAPLRRARR